MEEGPVGSGGDDSCRIERVASDYKAMAGTLIGSPGEAQDDEEDGCDEVELGKQIGDDEGGHRHHRRVEETGHLRLAKEATIPFATCRAVGGEGWFMMPPVTPTPRRGREGGREAH